MSIKYVALDVHQATTAATVRDQTGRILQRQVLETTQAALLSFIRSLRRPVHVAFEEGTLAQWLYELLEHRVAELVVCDPRQNALLLSGSKNDRIDADKLSELLRLGALRPVHHATGSVKPLREYVRGYEALLEDSVRLMLRIKAIFRGRAISTAGERLYQPAHRSTWLEQLTREPAARERAESLFAQLDAVMELRERVRRSMIATAKQHDAYERIRSVPFIGPVRAAEILAYMVTPHRFRTRRQLWAYSGLAVITHTSGDHRFESGRLIRRPTTATRGLNHNFHRVLKKVFKQAAFDASIHRGPLRSSFERMLQNGIRSDMARLTLARKIAAIVLAVWKRGENFDERRLTSAVA
jgi:transposase